MLEPEREMSAHGEKTAMAAGCGRPCVERLPVLGRALAQVERLGAHGRVNSISLLLAHISS
jgi:hypothetical protein